MAIKQMLASALSHTRNIVPPAKTWRGAKLRKRLGTGLAIAAAGLALVAANPIVPAATAGTSSAVGGVGGAGGAGRARAGCGGHRSVDPPALCRSKARAR